MALEVVRDTVIAPLPSTERGQGLHLGGTLQKSPRIIYCSKELVVQRNVEKTNEISINPEHSVNAKVAKFSPNGEWVASGDEGGQIFVWAHQSFVVKNTINVGKQCLDIAWSNDGQRIVAVGRGKDEKGKVFPWNTNNKLGELGGARKGFLCCDFKPNRPFRVITGSEDFGVYYYKGPPFKFEASCKDHGNYVNGIAFTPDGSAYVSVSSDKKILVFDGKTGKKLRQIADGKGKNGEHKGSIYEISFSSDGKHFVTASADKTCKVWDYESGKVMHTYEFMDAGAAKPTLQDMQVGCLWMDKWIISVSLSGKINYLDPEFKQAKPIRVVTGHQKTVNDVAFDCKTNALYSCDSACRVVKTECKAMECSDVVGDPHKAPALNFIAISADNSCFWTIGVNDTLCQTMIGDDNDEKSNEQRMGEKVIKLDGAARGCVAGNVDANLVIVPTHKMKVHFIDGLAIKSVMDIKYSPLCLALSDDDSLLAIGSGRDGDNCVYFYDVVDGVGKGEAFVLNCKQYLRSEVIKIALSPQGEYLATACKDRTIWIWDIRKRKDSVFEKPMNFNKGMQYHNGQISSIVFGGAQGAQLLSCGHGSTLMLWTAPTQGKNDYVRLEHAFTGSIKKAIFTADDQICAIGADCTIRFFNVQPKAASRRQYSRRMIKYALSEPIAHI